MSEQPLREVPFQSAVSPPNGWQGCAGWLIFRRFDLLLHDDGELAGIPNLHAPADIGLDALVTHYLGASRDGDETTHYFAADVDPETDPPPGMSFVGLRAAYGRLTETAFQIAGHAVQIVNWDRTHRYCGRCGHETDDSPTERAKVCSQLRPEQLSSNLTSHDC